MKIQRIRENDHTWKVSLSIAEAEDVSRLWIFEYQMRFGSARLKMGGIGGVGTNEEHRMKGYARHVMADSTALMVEHGFDVAMLFGIADFYPKFGYATVLPEAWITLKTTDALEAVQSYQVREFEPHDVPAVLQIFAANSATRTGTVIRDAGRWNKFKMGSSFREEAAPFVVLDERAKVIGYFVCDDTEKHCKLSELGFRDRSIFETIVGFLGERAKQIEQEQIECSVPADHEFANFCRRYGCRMTVNYRKNAGGMMRIIHQHRTFEKLCGELEKRLQGSKPHASWSGNLLIATELGESRLTIDVGKIVSAPSNRTDKNYRLNYRLEIPQDKLIQLMMGCRCIEELSLAPDVLVDTEILPLLDTLFPTSNPHVWWPNRF